MDRIVTERLVLRRAREEDLEAMHEVLSHPLATRYWSTPPHDSIEQTRERLAAMIEDAPGERDDYVIERGGRVIGKAGCFRLPEIGYILHPDHWGQGIATEALRAVIRSIFGRHAIEALRADVDPRNLRSIQMLERLGFTVSGRASRTWHVAGEWCDSLYLTLPRPDHMAE